VLAIIVTFNGHKWIEKCIASLQSQTHKVDIFLIDNNSHDNTLELIRERFPDLVVYSSSVNLGFGKANNLGFIHALKNKYHYVLLLNQDAFLSPDTVNKLYVHCESNPEIGIISPMQLDPDTKTIESKFVNFITRTDTNKEIISDLYFSRIKSLYYIEFIQAAIWFMPISTIESLGGFDPVFFHYGEDRDYCMRLQKTAKHVAISTQSIGYHAAENYIPAKISFRERLKRNTLISQVYLIYGLKHYDGCFLLRLIIEYLKICNELLIDILNRSGSGILSKGYLFWFLSKNTISIFKSRKRQFVKMNHLIPLYESIVLGKHSNSRTKE